MQHSIFLDLKFYLPAKYIKKSYQKNPIELHGKKQKKSRLDTAEPSKQSLPQKEKLGALKCSLLYNLNNVLTFSRLSNY